MYYKYNLRLHVSEDSSTIEYTKYTTAKYSTCQLYCSMNRYCSMNNYKLT